MNIDKTNEFLVHNLIFEFHHSKTIFICSNRYYRVGTK
jgi:hypothetical protein